jgi:hypothetical protein
MPVSVYCGAWPTLAVINDGRQDAGGTSGSSVTTRGPALSASDTNSHETLSGAGRSVSGIDGLGAACYLSGLSMQALVG